jgi:DNA-binding transcriptional MerR regulator
MLKYIRVSKMNIKDVSKKTSISSHAIRYYESMGLLHPKRGENNYRIYSDIDVFILKMIIVLQYSNFDLKSIGIIIKSLLFNKPSEECNTTVNHLFHDKIQELESTIHHYEMIISLLKKVPLTETSAEFHQNKDKITNMISDIVEKIFSQIKESK